MFLTDQLLYMRRTLKYAIKRIRCRLVLASDVGDSGKPWLTELLRFACASAIWFVARTTLIHPLSRAEATGSFIVFAFGYIFILLLDACGISPDDNPAKHSMLVTLKEDEALEIRDEQAIRARIKNGKNLVSPVALPDAEVLVRPVVSSTDTGVLLRAITDDELL